MHRRRFIQSLSTLAGTGLLLPGCGVPTPRQIPGEIIGASAAVGHLLRDGGLKGAPEPAGVTDVVIVGGGISGLSAARWLKKQGVDHFVLFDLESKPVVMLPVGRTTYALIPGERIIYPYLIMI
jgi:NADPH-dependent 2,4-dienoyl-CoA reductase/sulfur reductase-like enzyme